MQDSLAWNLLGGPSSGSNARNDFGGISFAAGGDVLPDESPVDGALELSAGARPFVPRSKFSAAPSSANQQFGGLVNSDPSWLLGPSSGGSLLQPPVGGGVGFDFLGGGGATSLLSGTAGTVGGSVVPPGLAGLQHSNSGLDRDLLSVDLLESYLPSGLNLDEPFDFGSPLGGSAVDLDSILRLDSKHKP